MHFTRVSPETVSVESTYYFRYPVTFIWLLNLDVEMKDYEKTKDSRDDMYETHCRIQFIGPQEK
jgi:hypothetical protein